MRRRMNIRDIDTNKDGVVSEAELQAKQSELDIENKDKKEDQQRRMAWVAMLSMVVFTAILFSPMISVDRVNALSNLLSMFYIAQAGVVATFFGAQAYLSK